MNPFDEFKACQDDFTHFCKHINILHPIRGYIPFTLFDYQKKIIEQYNNERFIIYKKFRGGGFTTITMAWALWRCAFHTNENILICGHGDDNQGLLKMVNRMYFMIPDWLKPPLKVNGMYKEFTVTNSILSFGYLPTNVKRTYLIIDEAAFHTGLHDKWQLTFPFVDKCIAYSTPNGIDGWFYDIYHRANAGLNTFKIIETGYKDHPEHTEQWEEKTKECLGHEGWQQEVLGNFVAHPYI